MDEAGFRFGPDYVAQQRGRGHDWHQRFDIGTPTVQLAGRTTHATEPPLTADEPIANPLGDFEAEVHDFLERQGVPSEKIQLAVPPEPEYGEAASNAAFLLAKERREPPPRIASSIAEASGVSSFRFIERVEAAPTGFINFFLDYDAFVGHALTEIERAGEDFGRLQIGVTRRVVEHTSVNPNKEWHIGHLRNVVMGDVLARIARRVGEVVEVQNYIDDTGRQAAEAVLGLRLYGLGHQDESQKFDHVVGRRYVRLNGELEGGREERRAELESALTEILHEMEAGRHRDLVERLLRAQLETASRIGATYDLLIWESDIVRRRLLDEALEVLKRSPRVFVPDSGQYQGALVIELEAKPGKAAEGQEPQLRVLVRSNGLPTYTGKDITYMMWKFGLLDAKLDFCDFPSSVPDVKTSCPQGAPGSPFAPDQVVNVVAEHQALQQRTVIEGLAAAGYAAEAGRAHHLSYGMVSQAEGRISGRRGLGSSADDVIDGAAAVARERIREKRQDLSEVEQSSIAEAIAIGALRYLMVQYSPVRPIVFDLRDVVSFEGNTGLYLQYALVRIEAILGRAAEAGIATEAVAAADLRLLRHPAERSLVLKLARFPAALADALRTLNVNVTAEYAFTLAGEFSQFYRDCPILQADDDLKLARLRLLESVRSVLSAAVAVLGIPRVRKL